MKQRPWCALFLLTASHVVRAQDFKSCQNYDFVPGDKILIEDDLRGERRQRPTVFRAIAAALDRQEFRRFDICESHGLDRRIIHRVEDRLDRPDGGCLEETPGLSS